jgi:hypothetical protein
MDAPIKWVCNHCGSDNLEVEAYASWSIQYQKWLFEIAENQDRDYCFDCGDNTTVCPKPLTELKEIAIAMAHKPNVE